MNRTGLNKARTNVGHIYTCRIFSKNPHIAIEADLSHSFIQKWLLRICFESDSGLGTLTAERGRATFSGYHHTGGSISVTEFGEEWESSSQNSVQNRIQRFSKHSLALWIIFLLPMVICYNSSEASEEGAAPYLLRRNGCLSSLFNLDLYLFFLPIHNNPDTSMWKKIIYQSFLKLIHFQFDSPKERLLQCLFRVHIFNVSQWHCWGKQFSYLHIHDPLLRVH